MISIYVDWNVVSQMRGGKFPELKKMLSQKDRFNIYYSTAHIGDILSSYKAGNNQQQQLIDEDLEYLSGLTDNFCICNDGTNIRLSYELPKTLFDQRVDEIDLLKDFSLSKLEELLNELPELKGLGKSVINNLKSQTLDQAFIDTLKNPESAKQLETIFPGLSNNPTMEGFFKSFGKMITNLNENEDYKELRLITQSGLKINRDKIFNTADPFDMISDAYKKLGIKDQNQFIHGHNKSPDWFDEFTNNYIALDMHGYQEDKVNTKKGRKETFNNTTNDAFHAAFSSTCNIYILNDDKSFKKTQKVFEELKLNTLIFKPVEFKEYHDSFLKERAADIDLKLPHQIIMSKPDTEKIADNTIIKSHYAPFFMFDYFNNIHSLYDIDGKLKMIVLSQIVPTNRGITYYFEIENLSKKLYSVLGQDSDNLGTVSKSELEQKDWIGRKWKFDGIGFRFTRSKGHYQFYYDY